MLLVNVQEVNYLYIVLNIKYNVKIKYFYYQYKLLGVNGTERLVGNGLLESIVFGTTAGLRASQTILNDSVTSLETWTPLKLRYRIKVLYKTILFNIILFYLI